MKNNFCIYSFYYFINIKEARKIKNKLDNFLSSYVVRGTILLADEGINASLSASKNDLDEIIIFIKKLLGIRKIDLKVNKIDFLPFNKMKVRLKKEIVTLGMGDLKIDSFGSNYVDPSEWDKILLDKNTEIIDVRNNFEIQIGKFSGALNPKMKSFREFPEKISNLNLNKKSRIAMYCTGGIRCEKASAYLKHNGFENIVQLNGGIINYLTYLKSSRKNSLWNGECFVFDGRVSLDQNLQKGKYIQCYGCRRPITKEDTKSKKYIKGVSCPYCYNERSLEKKRNSLVRQKQIDEANEKKVDHTFKKIV